MRTLRSAPAWVGVATLVAVSTVLRFWAATRVPTPWIAPDELIYAELGRSLWEHGTLDLLGRSTSFFSLVYPALAGGPLSLRDVDAGYTLLKALQALVMSLAAVPVFLWTRTFVSERLALLAAALTLAVPGLVYSGLVLTEVPFYPLLALAAWAAAAALVRPTLARQGLAVGTIVLLAATRLQGVALAPALVTALVLKAAFDRDLRQLRRFWPTFAAFALLAAGWSAWQLRNGGPPSKLFGAYRAAGEVHYSLGDAARFVVYHAADVVLFTGILPVCALGVLLAAPRELTAEARAYVAVAASTAAWLTAEVGVFASRHVGHLAERNLFALAPVLFPAVPLWLARGAPRPRLATALVVAAAFLAVLALPVDRFVTAATIPDAPTLIPLHRLHVRLPGLSPELVLDLAAAAALAAFALAPRRAAPALAAALLVALAAISLSASRVVAAQATLVQPGTVGPEPRWIDAAARGPAAYLYTGDVYWNSVWESVFWNRRLRSVYDLLEAEVPGGIPQESLGPYEDGRLVDKHGRTPRVPYVVASDSLRFAGVRIADGRNGIALWRLDPPLRLTQWIQNVRFDGVVERHAKAFVYACRGGALVLRLRAPQDLHLTILRNERPYRRRSLAAGETWELTVPARPRPPLGRHLCSFDVLTTGPVQALELAVRR